MGTIQWDSKPAGGGSSSSSGSGGSSGTIQWDSKPGKSSGGGGGGGFLGLGGLLSRAWSGISNAVTRAPAGLFQLGNDLGNVAVGAGENIVNDVAGTKFGGAGAGVGGSGLIASPSEVQAKLNTLPALGGMEHGMVTTFAHHLNPAELPQTVADYWHNPVGSALNDAANLSIVAGPLARTLAPVEGAAGAAGALGKVADVSGTIANAPFSVPRLAVGALGNALEDTRLGAVAPALQAIGKGGYLSQIGTAGMDAVQAGSDSHLANLASHLSPLRQEATALASQGKQEAAMATDALAKHDLLPFTKALPNPDEQLAAIVLREGQGTDFAAQRSAMGQQAFDQFITDHYQGTITNKAANLVADVATGKNPDLAAKIADANNIGATSRAARDAAYVAQPGHAFQSTYEANPAGVQAAVDKAAPKLAAAQDVAAEARQKADLAATSAPGTPIHVALEQQAQVAEGKVAQLSAAADQARAQAADDLANAPARLTPILSHNRAAADAMSEMAKQFTSQGLHDQAAQLAQAIKEMPTTLRDLQAQGRDAEYFPHTQEDKGAAGVSRSGLGRTFKQGFEKNRVGSPIYDRSVGGELKGEAQRITKQVQAATWDRVSQSSFAARIGQGPLADIQAGPNAIKEAAARGYTATDPRTLFGKVGEGSKVDANTLFLPTPIHDEMVKYFAPQRGPFYHALSLATDVPNRLNFMARLSLSPAMVTGRIFGHAMLGFASTDHPAELARQIIQSIRYHHQTGEFLPPEEMAVGGRMLKAGSAVSEVNRLNTETTARQAQGQGARVSGLLNKAINNKVTGVSQNVAKYLDNVERSAFYMTERAKGAAPDAALRTGLRAEGDFAKMSPVEQDYVRKIVPFYVWHRELTKIAFHLAEDHPMRVAWTLHLGDIAHQAGPQLPGYANLTVPFGKSLVGARMLFPFGEVGALAGGGYGGVGKLLGPVPQLALGKLSGVNPSTGNAYTRPANTGRYKGSTQEPTAPPLLQMLKPMIPQEALLAHTLGQDNVVRYDTGQPILSHGAPIPANNSTGGVLARFAGFPVYNKNQAIASEQKNQAAAAKRAALLAKSSAGSGGIKWG